MITTNNNFYSYVENLCANLNNQETNSEESQDSEKEQNTDLGVKLYYENDKCYKYKIKEKKRDPKDKHLIYYLKDGKIIIHITKEEEKKIENRVKIINETLFIKKNNKLIGPGENSPKIFENIEEYEKHKEKNKQINKNENEIKEYRSLKDYFYNKYIIKNNYLDELNIKLKKYKEIFSNSPYKTKIKTLSEKVEFLKNRIVNLENNKEIFNLIKKNNLEIQKINKYIENISLLNKNIMSHNNLLKYNEKNLKNLKETYKKICSLLENFKEYKDENKIENNKIKDELLKIKNSIEAFLNRTKKNENSFICLDFDYEKNSYFLISPNKDIIYIKNEEYEKFLLNPNDKIFSQLHKNNMNSINIIDEKNNLKHQSFNNNLEKYDEKYIKKTYENLNDYSKSRYNLSINDKYLNRYNILKKELNLIKEELKNFSIEYFEKAKISLEKIDQEEKLMLKTNILKDEFINPLKNFYNIYNRYIDNIKNIGIKVKETDPLKKEIDSLEKHILFVKSKIKKDIDNLLLKITNCLKEYEKNNKLLLNDYCVLKLKKYLEEIHIISINNETNQTIKEPKNILEDLEKIQNELNGNISLNIKKNKQEKNKIKKTKINILNKLEKEDQIYILNENLDDFIENYIKKSVFLLNDFQKKNTLKEKLVFFKKNIINPLDSLFKIINSYNEIKKSGLKILKMNSFEKNIALIREKLGKISNEILEIIKEHCTNPNSIETLYFPICYIINYNKKNNKIIFKKDHDIYINSISIIKEKLKNYNIKILENIKNEITDDIENLKKYLIKYLTKIYEITNEKTKKNKEQISENIKNNVNSFIDEIINKKPEIYNKKIKKLLLFNEEEELKKINFKEDVILLEDEYKNFNKIYKEFISKENIKTFGTILEKIISIHDDLQEPHIFNTIKNNDQKTLYYLNEILILEKKLISLKKFYNQKPEILNSKNLNNNFYESYTKILNPPENFFNLYNNIFEHIEYYKNFLIINYNNIKIDDYIKNCIKIFKQKTIKLSLFNQLKFLDENCFKIIKDNLDLIEEIKTFYVWKCIKSDGIFSILNYIYDKNILDNLNLNLQKKLEFNFNKVSEIYEKILNKLSNNYDSEYKLEIEKIIIENNKEIDSLNSYNPMKIKLKKMKEDINLIDDFINKYSSYSNIQQDIKFKDIEEKRKSLNEEIKNLEQKIKNYEQIIDDLRNKNSEISYNYRSHITNNIYYYKEYEKYNYVKERNAMRKNISFDFYFKNNNEKEINIKNYLKELANYIENNYKNCDEDFKNNKELLNEYIKNEYYDNFY